MSHLLQLVLRRLRRPVLSPLRRLTRHPWLVAVAGLAWLALRSGSKPSRLSYPCQQAALGSATMVFGIPLAHWAHRTSHRLRRRPVALGALTVVVEQRALRRYQEHLRRPNVDDETREVLRLVSKDEGWHLDWMRKKGRELAQKAGEPERFDEAIRRFRKIDEEVMADIDELERSLPS